MLVCNAITWSMRVLKIKPPLRGRSPGPRILHSGDGPNRRASKIYRDAPAKYKISELVKYQNDEQDTIR